MPFIYDALGYFARGEHALHRLVSNLLGPYKAMHTSNFHSAATQEAFDASARNLACGEDQSFCRGAMKSAYQDLLRGDSCAVETYVADSERQFDYNMWLPIYANNVRRGSAFLNASSDTNRFAPKQVKQESFLQGRGQVSSNPNCKAGFLRYLPESIFEDKAPERQPWDMHLFAQPTLVPRSCASVTELDMIQRMKPLAEAYQGRYTPLLGENSGSARKRYEDGVTLSTKKYVDFAEAAKMDKYS